MPLRYTITPTDDSQVALETMFIQMLTAPEALARQVDKFVPDILAYAFEETFETEGYEQWEPLSDITIQDRIDNGFPGEHPILTRTGDMRRSLTDRSDPMCDIALYEHTPGLWLFMYGTKDPKFLEHEEGREYPPMPARPMHLEGDHEATVIHDVAEFMAEVLDRHFRGMNG